MRKKTMYFWDYYLHTIPEICKILGVAYPTAKLYLDMGIRTTEELERYRMNGFKHEALQKQEKAKAMV